MSIDVASALLRLVVAVSSCNASEDVYSCRNQFGGKTANIEYAKIRTGQNREQQAASSRPVQPESKQSLACCSMSGHRSHSRVTVRDVDAGVATVDARLCAVDDDGPDNASSSQAEESEEC